jgi:parvulin-like peptidyl-prolyl isomerase
MSSLSRFIHAVAAVLAGVALGGCASSQPKSLTADAFMPEPAVSATSPDLDRSPAPQVAADLPKTAVALPAPTTEPADHPPALDPSPAGEPTLASASTTTQPAESPTTAPVAQDLYMTVGGVVAEVNGTPIYANELLRKLDKILAAKAREMDRSSFETYARELLRRQREEMIQSEREYAAAERLLTPDDKKLIDQMAMPRFYQQKVIEAGGSVEQARHKAKAEGDDFDEMLRREHRKEMQELFRERKITPRIQVSADDMREYYRMHIEDYTERAQAQFRVIKIDPKRIGGDDARAAALARINAIREKAINGADFATLASVENQDDYLKANAGDPGGWMQRDAYRIDKIDKAVWELQPGQITPVIADGDAFYIAKLEARKDGRVQPFEDQQVQDKIHSELARRQFVQLLASIDAQLEGESIVRRDDALLDTAVDMAMQKYTQWARR